MRAPAGQAAGAYPNGHFERYEFIIRAKIVEYFAAQPVDYADVEGLFKNSRRCAGAAAHGQSL
jgi:hypothetical protein